MLRKCPTANAWSMEEADAWWGSHERERIRSAESSPEAPTTEVTLERTMASASAHDGEDQPIDGQNPANP